MSRNRVRTTHTLHWAAVTRWIAILVLACALLGSYVVLKNKVLRLAAEVHDREVELDSWQKRNQQLQCNLARITSFQALQQRLGLRSGLVNIGQLEIVRMESFGMASTTVPRVGGVAP
ncbi:MAG: hypothetical protein PW734_06225 [Verrucomicrobium sp.]|nr:hypothetical protein [Verrucomicrobium sp.]